jgi:hypothetical protein
VIALAAPGATGPNVDAVGGIGSGECRDEWVSVQLLVLAADLVPVVGGCPPLHVDVHECLCAAAAVADMGGGAVAHRLADAAETLLTDYLVQSGLARADEPGGTLRRWLVGRSPDRVARELRGAAGFNRLRLLAKELGCDGLFAVLLAEARGTHGRGNRPGVVADAGRPVAAVVAPW